MFSELGNLCTWDLLFFENQLEVSVKLLIHQLNTSNNNKRSYAGTTESFTHLRVLPVLTDRSILAQSNECC
jgi:hypothetical protein